jgi:predicted nucleic acid-binding protein
VVVDANVALRACLAESGFSDLEAHELVAPPLMWIEAGSGIHELKWRREIADDVAEAAFSRLGAAPVAERRHRHLAERAWTVADELGWAKLYDAYYVALAILLGIPLLTIDARLRRRASRVVEVIGPTELPR